MELPPIPPAPEWVSAAEWTPEQQESELKRRMVLLGAFFSLDTHLQPRPSDVLVATPSKSGTTWVTHICHQLRMRGSEPDFERQEDVVPMLELSKTMGVDPQTMPQPADPRIFLTYHILGCLRASQMVLKGRVSKALYFGAFAKSGAINQFLPRLLEWWEHRNDQDVLFLFFDDLKEDHTGCVRRIAKFIGVDCTEEEIARVVHSTTHSEMARHSSKFDLRQIALKITEIVGDDPPTEFVSRVRPEGGKSGDGEKDLPQELKQLLAQMWKEEVEAKLGFKNMGEMREAWKKERGW